MARAKHESTVDQPSQIDKFRDLARELECDDDEKAFDEKLKKIANAPHEPHPNKPPA